MRGRLQAVGPADGRDSVADACGRRCARRSAGGIKAWVSGGAPLNPEVGLFFQSLGITFLQGYGQTEAGPVIGCNRPSAGIRLDTVGPPVKNTEVRIAEDGEIMVRGENVMHGYWRNPEETARVLQGRLAGNRRRRPFRRQGPDRHHRPQEGPDRQRQGRQYLAAADRRDADAAGRDRAGDGLWRPPPAHGRLARAGSGDRVRAGPARSGCSARSTASTPTFR